MNFNKLRSICDDIKEVVKALKYSTILKVSEDETKVSRLTPFSQRSQEEIDQCTIYVVSYIIICYVNVYHLFFYLNRNNYHQMPLWNG